MSEFEIRWANQNDWHELAMVHVQAYRSVYKEIMPADYIDGFTIEKRQVYYQKILNEGIEKIALMFADHNMIGFITVEKCRECDVDDIYGEILAIYLLPEYWGKGFGKRLIYWAIERMNELGYRKSLLWVLAENTNARKFYEQLGFRFDGTERVISRGKELVQMRYQKALVS